MRLRDLSRKALSYFGYRLIGLSMHIPSSSVRIVKREGDWITCQVNGIVWRLNKAWYIDGEILKHAVFEPDSTKWVLRLVRPGMIVADVGANFGYYSIHLSRLVGDAGQVHAFEPSKFFRDRLLLHKRINSCSNIVVSEHALSDCATTQEFYTDHVSGSLHWVSDTEPLTVETVQLRTFDSYVDEVGLPRLDFIKVDTDGNEPRFVIGAKQTLQKFHPIILMEFSHLHFLKFGSGVDKLADQLNDIGYCLYSVQTGKKYNSHTQFLIDAMNCAYSTNIICYPGDAGEDLNENVDS